MLDWDDLRYFQAVAEHGSRSAAAKVLRVAQPTVGRRVAALERRLGSKLFIGTTLTDTGRRMLRHVEQMEQGARAAELLGTGRDVGLRGRVTVTASEWLINRVVAPALATLSSEHPGLELDLVADTRPLDLGRGEADIALRPARFTHADVTQRELGRLEFALYASRDYLALHGLPDFAQGASGHRVIAMSEALTTVVDVDFLARVASNANLVARANGREPMAALALAGVGLTCLPRLLGDQTALQRLDVAGPTRSLWLGVHRDVRSVPRVRAVTSLLTAIFRG